MKIGLLLGLLLGCATYTTVYPAPVIFSGNDVKALKANLNLNDSVKVLSGSADPTAVAQSAPKGSLYLRNGASGGKVYKKLDDGSSTNWTELAGTGLESNAFDIRNSSLANSVAANALTVALKTSGGSDPSGGDTVDISFRSSTITTGSWNTRSVSAALSVVVTSGATLGHVSAIAEPIHVYAIDNAGTVELAVSSTLFVDEGKLYSTTVMNSSSDDRYTLYSTTARTGVPIRLIGRLISNQTTAGTWAATATENAPYVKVFQLGTTDSRQTILNSAVVAGATVATSCTSSPCVVYRETGDWINTVTRSAQGVYVLNIHTGIFSDIPNCVCSGDNHEGGGRPQCNVLERISTTTSVEIRLQDDTGNVALNDGTFTVQCHGAK